MKKNRSLLLLSCLVVAAFMLPALQLIATECNDNCSNDAPVCQCATCCNFKVMTVPSNDSLATVYVLQYSVELESSQYFFLLAPDIFRPPIC